MRAVTAVALMFAAAHRDCTALPSASGLGRKSGKASPPTDALRSKSGRSPSVKAAKAGKSTTTSPPTDINSTISDSIGCTGGTVSSEDGSFSIDFPVDAFNSEVEVAGEQVPNTNAVYTANFEDSTEIYLPPASPPYYIQVALTSPPLTESVTVTFTVPGDFLQSVPDGDSVRLFARFMGAETDNHIGYPVFELVEGCELEISKLTCDLPSYAFTDFGDGQGFAAVLTLTSSPGPQAQPGTLSRRGLTNNSYFQQQQERALQQGVCKANSILCPIQGGCAGARISSPYGLRTFTNAQGVVQTSFHYGTDYAIDVGTPLVAVVDGVIERAGNSNSGAGWRVQLRAADCDGTASRSNNGFRYLHMKENSLTVSEGQFVSAGTVIGLSGNTGSASTGAHLHFEMAPSGALYKNPARIDPVSCIQANVGGSIVVGDILGLLFGGDFADDAFKVSLDCKELGSTTVGAFNSIGIGTLFPGEYELSLEVIIASDDGLGTWFIELNDGVTFLDGSTSLIGFDPLGTMQTYTIVVPEVENEVA